MTSHSCWRSKRKCVPEMKYVWMKLFMCMYVCMQVHVTCIHGMTVCFGAGGSVGVDVGLIFLILQTAEE